MAYNRKQLARMEEARIQSRDMNMNMVRMYALWENSLEFLEWANSKDPERRALFEEFCREHPEIAKLLEKQFWMMANKIIPSKIIHDTPQGGSPARRIKAEDLERSIESGSLTMEQIKQLAGIEDAEYEEPLDEDAEQETT